MNQVRTLLRKRCRTLRIVFSRLPLLHALAAAGGFEADEAGDGFGGHAGGFAETLQRARGFSGFDDTDVGLALFAFHGADYSQCEATDGSRMPRIRWRLVVRKSSHG